MSIVFDGKVVEGTAPGSVSINDRGSYPFVITKNVTTIAGPSGGQVQAHMEKQTAELKAILENAQKSSWVEEPLKVRSPQAGWEMGMVSWVTSDKNGLIYLLQRGDKADPVMAIC